MALYPIKVLLDKDRNVFIPFLPANAIPINGTDETVASALENRYTKDEVDNIIKSLGTIQVLRGRVNTYEDLLAIENPRAGDVYIVGTSDTENAEYMYIGNTWERLGPMVDLSNLVTIDDLINRLSVYATMKYVDDRIDTLNSQTDNKLANYYTKAEVDAIVKSIVEQLQYTPTSQDISNLSIILGEDASTVEYTSTNSSVNYKLDNIIGGNK